MVPRDVASRNAAAICDDGPASMWQQVWAPAQLCSLVLLFTMVLRAWRTAGRLK